jgi:hypothetical protein
MPIYMYLHTYIIYIGNAQSISRATAAAEKENIYIYINVYMCIHTYI